MKIDLCPVCNYDQFKIVNYTKNPTQDEWEFDCFKNKKLSRCKKCNFTFTSELFEEGSLSKFYNTLYKNNKLSPFKPYFHYEFTSRSFSHVSFIRANVDLINNMNILEIGPNQNGMIPSFSLFCKSSYFYFEQFEFPVIKHYGGQRLGAYFNKEVALSTDVKNKMDLIVLSHSFEHFEPSTLNESVEAMRFALKSNGYISIEVPFEDESDLTAPHTVFFNVTNLSLLLKNHGFDIVSTQCIKSDTSGKQVKGKNNSMKTVLGIRSLLKMLLSLRICRKYIFKFMMPYFHNKLKVLYDGRPYIRVLAKVKGESDTIC